jgi:uncharacterized membrane protein YdbT with pleckstrin-like domain
MTTAPDSKGDSQAVPSWLELSDRETLVWLGEPRIQTVYLGLAVGVVVAAVAVLVDTVPTIAAVLGAGPPIVVYLWVRTTAYAVTTTGLYHRSGIVGRSVTAVEFETVENISYSQGITGTLFDWGRVEFDTAGSTGNELTFRRIDDPRSIRQLVDDQLSRASRDATAREIPGTIEQWQNVLAELKAIRQTIDHQERRE